MNYAVRLMGIGRTHIFLYYAVKPIRGYTCDAWPLSDASSAVRMVPLQLEYSVELPYSSSYLLPEVLLTIEWHKTNDLWLLIQVFYVQQRFEMSQIMP